MNKEIIAVFQDCVLCGAKGHKKIAEYSKKGTTIRKVGFTTKEGRELINKAVLEHKIGSMPFYTDGENFATSIDELLEKIPKPAKNRKKIPKTATLEKKTKITEEKEENGADTEA